VKALILATMLTLWCSATILAAGKPLQPRSELPIKITSDELVADNNRKTATFTGNVIARQADLTIYADKLVVSYAAEGNEISTAEVTGNVRIVQGARRAQSSRGVYDAKTGKIVLEGDPRVLQGDDQITGTVITYYLDEDRSEVTGRKGERVEAVIHPRGKGADGRPTKP
jgi:lipopolysaccharide export system protein LptA